MSIPPCSVEALFDTGHARLVDDRDAVPRGRIDGTPTASGHPNIIGGGPRNGKPSAIKLACAEWSTLPAPVPSAFVKEDRSAKFVWWCRLFLQVMAHHRRPSATMLVQSWWCLP
ncbi:hypothetical protein ACU4GD_31220 [Cupriavidus basilensis]